MNTLPDNSTLIECLSLLRIDDSPVFSNFEIISRETSIRSSTFPAEVIKCKLDNDIELTLLFKYLNGMQHNNFGHRGAVEYEAIIYDKVLRNTPLTTVKYYGTCTHESNNEMWMVLEFLDKSELLFRSEVKDQLEKAVAWIAELHTLYDSRAPEILTSYTLSYYHTWANKVEELNESFSMQYPWLPDLCNYFKENINLLLEFPYTCIHGEYYPNNILIRDGIIYPIDWESAAAGPGEIDLASIIDGWEHEIAENAIEKYIYYRWPKKDFDETSFRKKLHLARIYFHFRWIGGKPRKWEKYANRFVHLKLLGEQAGCI